MHRSSIPTKCIKVGPRDPDYITLFNKSLLSKRTKLTRRDKIDEINALASKINTIIVETRRNKISRLAGAPQRIVGKPPKELMYSQPEAYLRS